MTAIVERIQRRTRRELAHWRSNHEIERRAAEVEAHSRPQEGLHPVVFFNASTRLSGMSLNSAVSLLSAWSLRLQGVPVIHLVCQAGMSWCPLGTNRENPLRLPPCGECRAQSNHLYAHSRRVDLVYQEEAWLRKEIQALGTESLSQFNYRDVPLGELALPTVRWVLRRYHLDDVESTRFLLREYISSAWGLIQDFDLLAESESPQAVVVFNGQFYPEAAVRWAAARRGIRSIAHEMNLPRHSAFFTEGDATAYPIDIPSDFELDAAQNVQLNAYLEERFKGNFTTAGIRFWPEMNQLDPELLEKMKAFRQIVPVFTNVIFDTSQGQANVVFQHMFDWLNTVLEIVKAHPDTLFLIRSHPDETRPGKESHESVAGWVERNRVGALPNVVFIPSTQYLSSYELIQRAKFSMVYNSTIGLEAAILGKAVLCAGKARYTQYPTVFFPQTPQAFREQAEEFLQAGSITVPEEFRRNARRFLYYQLFRAALPFEQFIEDDGVWSGYVRLKAFDWRDLLPANSPAMRAITDGILKGRPFLIQ